MKLFLDHDVYALTARFLKDCGHDVVTAFDITRSRATDLELLTIAQQSGRVLVTRNRDFGELVFLQRVATGVIYLRISPSALTAGHKELETVLAAYPEDELRRAFVVVEPGRHRIRRIPG